MGVGVGAAVDGEDDGDADSGGDGLGELDALGAEVVLAAGEVEGEGEAVASLANAGTCVLTDSPDRRKPPVIRPAITARRCARDT